MRGQLVRCRPGQQDRLPSLNCGYFLVRGTEQIGQYGTCIHRGLPFAQLVAFGIGVGLDERGRCDFHHTHSIVERRPGLLNRCHFLPQLLDFGIEPPDGAESRVSRAVVPGP